jgi:hypothetical protein
MQLGYQALSVLMAGTYSFVVTFVLLKLVDLAVGLRVTADEEEAGLDLTQHGERGYIMGVELIGSRSYGEASSGFGASSAVDEPAASHALSS